MGNRKVIFAISMLKGGGAEKVLLHLAEEFGNRGWDCLILVTNQRRAEARIDESNGSANIRFCLDEIKITNPVMSPLRVFNTICRYYEIREKEIPDFAVKYSFINMYRQHVKWVSQILKENTKSPVIAFLQPTNQITLMASWRLSNPVILSERSDPKRYFRSRYANYFINNYYQKITTIVFQTPYAKECYPPHIKEKGVVIPNFISKQLPERYMGKREKVVVNYCRLTPEKNIKLLIDAFCLFYRSHNDYRLEIIGDGLLKDELVNYSFQKKIHNAVSFIEHTSDVHKRVIRYSMFVSSSNWEGLSNSMLESMAIGLPTICTDCEGGGARFIIQDHVNGLIVPKNDAGALCHAMCEVADNKQFQEKLSESASAIRDVLSIENIMDMWEKEILKAIK